MGINSCSYVTMTCISPAGSFKWDKLVRSSLASNIVGFINGGSEVSEPSWRAASVVSTVLVCTPDLQLHFVDTSFHLLPLHLPKRSVASPFPPALSYPQLQRISNPPEYRPATPGFRHRSCEPYWNNDSAPSKKSGEKGGQSLLSCLRW